MTPAIATALLCAGISLVSYLLGYSAASRQWRRVAATACSETERAQAIAARAIESQAESDAVTDELLRERRALLNECERRRERRVSLN